MGHGQGEGLGGEKLPWLHLEGVGRSHGPVRPLSSPPSEPRAELGWQMQGEVLCQDQELELRATTTPWGWTPWRHALRRR